MLLKFQAGFNIFSKMKKQKKFKSFHWLIILQTYRKRKKATLTLMHMQYCFLTLMFNHTQDTWLCYLMCYLSGDAAVL